jgi:transposase
MKTVPFFQQTISYPLVLPFTGIDVSKDDLHVSLRPLDGISPKLACSTIPNTVQAIQAFLIKAPQAHYVFEATGVYSRRLEFSLSSLNIPFSKVNGLKAKSFALAMGGLKKNDRLDAISLRTYGEKCELNVSNPIDNQKILQQRYAQALNNIDKQLHNIHNQLHLLDYEAFEIDEIRQSFLNIQQTLFDEKDKILALIGSINTPNAQEGQALLKSIIGIGDVCAKLMWEATNGFIYFDKPKQAARIIGLVPVDDESGTIKRKRGICFTAHPKVRAALYVAAGSALQHNPFCKQLYQKLRAKGKAVKLARIAVVHKLVRIAHAVIKSGKPFDPNYVSLPPVN